MKFGLRRMISKLKLPPKRKRRRERCVMSHRKCPKDSVVARTCSPNRSTKGLWAMSTMKSMASRTTTEKRRRKTKSSGNKMPWIKKLERDTLNMWKQSGC
jgi:hypothetical protein